MEKYGIIYILCVWRPIKVKIDWNRKYSTIAVYAFLVIASSILFFLIMSGLDGFLNAIGRYMSILYPFIYGFVIAYVINFLVVFADKWLSKTALGKPELRRRKEVLSLILGYFAAAAFIALFLAFILPQLVASITGLVMELPKYITNISNLIEDLNERYTLDPRVVTFLQQRWDELSVSLNNLVKEILPATVGFIRSTATSIWNVFLGIVVSLYLLSDKRKFLATGKKVLYGVLAPRHAEKTIKLLTRTQTIFSKFLVGKVLDSLIIGIIAFVCLSLFKMPYTELVSFIIGVTNIIPFFGPFIGAIPSFIIILFVSPVKALWFLLFIFLLQQLDGNYIGPKILGESLGISSFWILFSILVAGKFLGVMGLIVGVPIFVLVYSIVKEYVELKLEAKGLPVNTAQYGEPGVLTEEKNSKDLNKEE